jgi:hypothetical protein
MIADTATERGLDFSAELITSVSRCDVARGISRYGITPRASGNNNRLSTLWRGAIFPCRRWKVTLQSIARTETFDMR